MYRYNLKLVIILKYYFKRKITRFKNADQNLVCFNHIVCRTNFTFIFYKFYDLYFLKLIS